MIRSCWTISSLNYQHNWGGTKMFQCLDRGFRKNTQNGWRLAPVQLLLLQLTRTNHVLRRIRRGIKILGKDFLQITKKKLSDCIARILLKIGGRRPGTQNHLYPLETIIFKRCSIIKTAYTCIDCRKKLFSPSSYTSSSTRVPWNWVMNVSWHVW